MYYNEICTLKGVLSRAGYLEEETDNLLATFVKLFILGRKYQMPTLQNNATDAIAHWIGGGLPERVLDAKVLPYA